MVDALLDTSIIIDILRKYKPDEDWLAEQGSFGITRLVWLETLDGVKDKVAQRVAIRLLRDFQLVQVNSEDLIWATDQIIRFGLSHNVSSFDCLIAAPSQRLQLPLYTRNIKHFTPMLGAWAQQPS